MKTSSFDALAALAPANATAARVVSRGTRMGACQGNYQAVGHLAGKSFAGHAANRRSDPSRNGPALSRKEVRAITRDWIWREKRESRIGMGRTLHLRNVWS